MLRRNGLDINDPDEKYSLKELPGKFSGLHLLAIMYTAFRQIDPTMDIGADFGAEYTAALDLQKQWAASRSRSTWPDAGRFATARLSLASATSGAHQAHGPKRWPHACGLAPSSSMRSGRDFCCGLLGRRLPLRRLFKFDRRN